MFETLAVHNPRVHVDALDGQVYHYRDKKGLECDAIHLKDGSSRLFEIKFGGSDQIDADAKSLSDLAANIDTTRLKSSVLIMVLTSVGNFSYQKENGGSSYGEYWALEEAEGAIVIPIHLLNSWHQQSQ